LTVSRACRFLGISRQAWYQAQRTQRERAGRDQRVIGFVHAIRRCQPRIGVRKLHYLLHQQTDVSLHLGRDQLFQVLRAHRLLVPRRRAYHKTTHSHHRFRRHPNLLKPGAGQVIAIRPNQVWVADITYLPTRSGMSYVSLVTDAYSRKIVGHHVHESLRSEDVEQALRQALRQRSGDQPLIHHSDRGIQYCCDRYQRLHARHGIQCSMTDGYDCYQNALAERVNGILKTEFLLVQPRNLDQARTMVNESVEIYNRDRPHLALKYKTPDAVHRVL
jgi:putative transposase